MENYGELRCSVTIETLNRCGQVSKRQNLNNAVLCLGRNEFKDIVLKINIETFQLSHFKVLSKFIRDGKASVMFSEISTNVFLSNAPPEKLNTFLKLLRIKSNIQKTVATDRVKLYSNVKKSFEEISPVTVQDVKVFHTKGCTMKSPLQPIVPQKRKTIDITPIRVKRKSAEVTPLRITSKGTVCTNPGARKRINSTPLNKIKLGTKLNCNSSYMKSTIAQIADMSPTSMTKKINFTGKLTNEQVKILGAVKQGYNIFFTGSAGTGKSYLLRKIIGALPPDVTVPSASTGVAACQIGGITLHSFAGIGSGEASIEHCIQLASRPSIANNWKRCQALVIDEISMVDSVFFEKLEQIARVVRNDERPFGGIQLILCGDFLQLPPVKTKEETKFCFQAKCWSSCIQLNFELTEVKRQSDKDFVNMLQYIRVGKCPDYVYDKLVAARSHDIEKFGIEATRLCTHKDSVENINNKKMKELTGKSKIYYSLDSDREYATQMDKSIQVLHKLELKVGSQVMLTKNLDVSRGLVNGARGVVLKFSSNKDELPIVKFSQGLEMQIKREKFVYKTSGGVVTRAQLPLKLAWAISIHKSQGLTLDCCEVSLARIFEHGQAYVALSRAKSLEGLRILDFNRDCIKANQDVLRFYIKLRREIRMSSFEDV